MGRKPILSKRTGYGRWSKEVKKKKKKDDFFSFLIFFVLLTCVCVCVCVCALFMNMKRYLKEHLEESMCGYVGFEI